MNSLTFKQQQPIAFQAITNSIRKEHFAHAYLLYGNEGVDLAEYAIFLIQSLLCEDSQDGLACGVCNNCQRIARGIYADLVILSGEEKRIGKNEVLQMMSLLSKTGIEKKSLKFYLINEVDNATTEALNSLLKFLEEPGNESTFAILTTHLPDRVLPTIVSRCLKIPFWGYKRSDLVDSKQAEESDSSDYYLSSNIAKSPKRIASLKDDEVYDRAVQVFRQVLSTMKKNFHEALVVLEKEGFIDKKTDKNFFGYWLALNVQFFKDLSYPDQVAEGWYRNLLGEYASYRSKSIKILPIFLSAYDQLNGSLNLVLLAENVFWQLKEVLK